MLNISMVDILFVAFGFLFQLWPLILVRAFDTRGDPFHSLAVLWIMLAAVRAFIAFDPHPLVPFTLVPEPGNTVLFAVTGLLLLGIWFAVRERRMRSLSLIGVVALVAALAVGLVWSRATSSGLGTPLVVSVPQAAGTLPTRAAGPSSYALGDVVSLADSAMVVVGWNSVPPTPGTKVREGYRSIDVELVLVNTGKTVATLSPGQRAMVKDQAEQRYSTETYSSGIGGVRLEKAYSLYPGERIHGKLRYQVPDAASELVFSYATDASGNQRVTIKLGGKPATVEAPALIAGEFALSLHQFGKRLTAGALALTVNKVSGSTPSLSKPAAGRRFVVVDVTIENHGDKSFEIGGLSQMLLRDAVFEQYSLDTASMISAKAPSPLGKLAAGDTVRGQAWFNVPDGAQELVFMFDANYAESVFSFRFDPAKRVLVQLF